MANNRTNGIEYFPMDVDIINDEKIRIACAKHGRTNTLAVIFWTLCHLYRQGYFYNWSDDNLAIFSMELNLEKDTLNDIILTLVEVGFFNKSAFEKYRILTSKSTQTRYTISTRKRKIVDIQPQYWLIDFPINGLTQKGKSDNPQNDGSKAPESGSVPPNGRPKTSTDSKNGDILRQSKVKESKVKETPPTPSSKDVQFFLFWDLIPAEFRVGEFETKRAWDMIKNTDEKYQAVEVYPIYLKYIKATGIFHCSPENFLKKKKYQDDWETQMQNHQKLKDNKYIETEAREPYIYEPSRKN